MPRPDSPAHRPCECELSPGEELTIDHRGRTVRRGRRGIVGVAVAVIACLVSAVSGQGIPAGASIGDVLKEYAALQTAVSRLKTSSSMHTSAALDRAGGGRAEPPSQASSMMGGGSSIEQREMSILTKAIGLGGPLSAALLPDGVQKLMLNAISMANAPQGQQGPSSARSTHAARQQLQQGGAASPWSPQAAGDAMKQYQDYMAKQAAIANEYHVQQKQQPQQQGQEQPGGQYPQQPYAQQQGHLPQQQQPGVYPPQQPGEYSQSGGYPGQPWVEQRPPPLSPGQHQGQGQVASKRGLLGGYVPDLVNPHPRLDDEIYREDLATLLVICFLVVFLGVFSVLVYILRRSLCPKKSDGPNARLGKINPPVEVAEVMGFQQDEEDEVEAVINASKDVLLGAVGVVGGVTNAVGGALGIVTNPFITASGMDLIDVADVTICYDDRSNGPCGLAGAGLLSEVLERKGYTVYALPTYAGQRDEVEDAVAACHTLHCSLFIFLASSSSAPTPSTLVHLARAATSFAVRKATPGVVVLSASKSIPKYSRKGWEMGPGNTGELNLEDTALAMRTLQLSLPQVGGALRQAKLADSGDECVLEEADCLAERWCMPPAQGGPGEAMLVGGYGDQTERSEWLYRPATNRMGSPRVSTPVRPLSDRDGRVSMATIRPTYTRPDLGFGA